MKIWTYYIIGFFVILVLYSSSASASDWTALKETEPRWFFNIDQHIINNPYNMINFDIWWEKTKNSSNYVRVLAYPLVKEQSIRYFIEDYSTGRCSLIDETQQKIRSEFENSNSLKFMIFFIDVKENENPMYSHNIELFSNYTKKLEFGKYKGRFSDLDYNATIKYQNGSIYKCNNSKWVINNQIEVIDYSQKEYQSSHSLILFCLI
ncbi:secreted protein [Candidatus Magnetomorum sp. HK-1]|nr:secreted protein [Candidatus Magnetomorum sp. HK-1]